jgi:hypothetical protein
MKLFVERLEKIQITKHKSANNMPFLLFVYVVLQRFFFIINKYGEHVTAANEKRKRIQCNYVM